MGWITGSGARGRVAVAAGAVAGAAALVAAVALAWPSSGSDARGHAAAPSAELAATRETFPPTTAPPASPAWSVPTTEDAQIPGDGQVDSQTCGGGNQAGDCCEFNDYADGECLEPGEWIDHGDYSDFCGCGETPAYDDTTMAPEQLPDGRHAVILLRVNPEAGMVQLD